MSDAQENTESKNPIQSLLGATGNALGQVGKTTQGLAAGGAKNVGGALTGAKNAVSSVAGGKNAEEEGAGDAAAQGGGDTTNLSHPGEKVEAEVEGHVGHGDLTKDTAIDAAKNAQDIAEESVRYAENQKGVMDEEARAMLLEAATSAQESAQEAMEKVAEREDGN